MRNIDINDWLKKYPVCGNIAYTLIVDMVTGATVGIGVSFCYDNVKTDRIITAGQLMETHWRSAVAITLCGMRKLRDGYRSQQKAELSRQSRAVKEGYIKLH